MKTDPTPRIGKVKEPATKAYDLNLTPGPTWVKKKRTLSIFLIVTHTLNK